MTNGIATSSAFSSSSPVLENLTVTGTTTTGALVAPIFTTGVCSGSSAFVVGTAPNNLQFKCSNGQLNIGTTTMAARLGSIS